MSKLRWCTTLTPGRDGGASTWNGTLALSDGDLRFRCLRVRAMPGGGALVRLEIWRGGQEATSPGARGLSASDVEMPSKAPAEKRALVL